MPGQGPGPGSARGTAGTRWPTPARVGWLALLAVVLLLAVDGLDWPVVITGAVALVVVRLVVGLLPTGPARAWALPVVLVVVLVACVAAAPSVWPLLVAAGVVGLVGALAVRAWRWWPVVAVFAMVLIGGTVGLVVWNYQQAHRPLLTPEEHEQEIARLRQPSPREVVGRLIADVASDQGTQACTWLFSPEAGHQLAAATGTDSCAAAVHQWATQVTDPRRYELVAWDYDQTNPPAGLTRVVVNACALSSGDPFNSTMPGPQLGVLTIESPTAPGWLITRFQPCPHH